MRVAVTADRPWRSGLLAITIVVIALLPASLNQALAYDRQAILHGEWWRLWSAHLTHFSLQHALLDALTLALLGSLAEKEFGPRHTFLLLLLGAPLISIALLISAPSLQEYRGASALSALLATAVGLSLWHSRPASRFLLGMVATALVAKTGFDACGISVTLAGLPDQVRVAWQAHLAGGLLGVALYFSLTLWSRPSGELRINPPSAPVAHR